MPEQTAEQKYQTAALAYHVMSSKAFSGIHIDSMEWDETVARLRETEAAFRNRERQVKATLTFNDCNLLRMAISEAKKYWERRVSPGDDMGHPAMILKRYAELQERLDATYDAAVDSAATMSLVR
jgi:hypothetical protein